MSRSTPASPSRAGRRRAWAGRAAVSTTLAVGMLLQLPGAAQASLPPDPRLPAGVEALQPYVGQLGCDPVAKPGVRAFQSLLLRAFPDTRTLGIVRDCGIGGRSEHKEGRAFDWGVSASNPTHVAHVRAVTGWLLAGTGAERAERARRFGIMYMIWNRQIWKAHQIDRGWQPYTGASPHTDHVHFSFGWNGARQSTSWWTGRVAPVDYGPYGTGTPTPVQPPPVTSPTVVPVPRPENLLLLATYSGRTLRVGSSGEAVRIVQEGLQITADGDFGPGTESAVKAFQTSRQLAPTGVFAAAEWRALFPRPVAPFGTFEALTARSVRGWAADADTTAPISVQVRIDGRTVTTARADLPRPGLATTHPGIGTAHGYDIPVAVPPGAHTVCVVGVNVGAGATTSTGCAKITVAASPLTATSRSTGTVHVFQHGPTGAAERRRFAEGTAAAPQSLGGRTLGAPAPVWRTSRQQEVVVRGTDDELYWTARTDTGYSSYRGLGGQVTSRPALSARGGGRVDLVARSASGSLAHRVSPAPGVWSAPRDLGGKVLAGTAPALAWTPSGRLDAFIVGTDQQVYRRSMTARGTWGSWEALGGRTTGDLTAVASSTAGVSLAMRGTDGKGYVRGVAAARGSGRWTGLGGVLAAAPAIANAPGTAVTHVFASGTNGVLYRNTRTAGVWTGWVKAG